MAFKNNSNALAAFIDKDYARKDRYAHDFKPKETPIPTYFKQIGIPEEQNYSQALTTHPYILPLKEPFINKPEPYLKHYKNYSERFKEEIDTVGPLPNKLNNYYKYSE